MPLDHHFEPGLPSRLPVWTPCRSLMTKRVKTLQFCKSKQLNSEFKGRTGQRTVLFKLGYAVQEDENSHNERAVDVDSR